MFDDLSVNVPAGSTYSWDFDDDGIIDDTSVGNVDYTYGSPGDYTARLIIETPASEQYQTTKTITVVAEPSVDFEVGATCSGELVTFTDQSLDVGTGSYYWDFDGDGIIDSEMAGDVTFTYPASGTYVASLLIESEGDCFGFKARNVQVSPSPQSGFSYTHATSGTSAIAQFENQSTDGIEFLYGILETEIVRRSPNPEHVFENFLGEVFEICLTTSNGCSQDQVCQSISFMVTGVQSLVEVGIRAYPNPSYGDLFLDFVEVERDEYKIQVHDLGGKLVMEKIVDTTISTAFKANLSSKGSYLLSITSSSLKARQKIVVR